MWWSDILAMPVQLGTRSYPVIERSLAQFGVDIVILHSALSETFGGVL